MGLTGKIGKGLAAAGAVAAGMRIVGACRRGEPFLVLSPQARFLWLAAALAPNATAERGELHRADRAAVRNSEIPRPHGNGR